MEITRRHVPEAAATLGAAGIAPVMARVFAARGIATAAELDNDLAGLPPWHTLKGIAAASERLASAIERGERLLIVADYDADGATACAVGMRGLAAMGATVELRRDERIRTLPLESFFLAYGKQDRQPGEFVRRVIVPKPPASTHFRAYKIS